MNDAALMRMLDGLADLDHQRQVLPRGQRVFVGILDQRLAMDEFQGKERLHAEAGFGTARLVNLRDAGMLQTTQRLRLLLEAPQQIGAGPGGLNHLQRDTAPRLILLRLVHGAHAALAQKADNAIAADDGWNPRLTSRCRTRRRRSTGRGQGHGFAIAGQRSRSPQCGEVVGQWREPSAGNQLQLSMPNRSATLQFKSLLPVTHHFRTLLQIKSGLSGLSGQYAKCTEIWPPVDNVSTLTVSLTRSSWDS
jgi:hypothetical protein